MEHWVKVHKFYCKGLVETDPAKPVHNAEECRSCFKSLIKKKKVYVLEPESVDLICSWRLIPEENLTEKVICNGVDQVFPVPFNAGEMKMEYKDETERTVALMQAILVKILMSEGQLYLLCGDLIEKLNDDLMSFRIMTWNWYLIMQPGNRLKEKIRFSYAKYSDQNIIKIEEKIKKGRINEYNLLLWWNVKLLHFFASCPPENFRILEHSIAHKSTWKTVLDEISDKWRLISKERMLEILKYNFGDIAKMCAGCKIDMNPEIIRIEKREKFDRPQCVLDVNAFFYCGKEECWDQLLWNWRSALGKYMDSAYFYNRCDGCGYPFKTLHRCGKCLTKYYCGTECRDKDWEIIHKKVCMKGEVDRKRKDGKIKREKAKTRELKNFFDGVMASFFESGEGN